MTGLYKKKRNVLHIICQKSRALPLLFASAFVLLLSGCGGSGSGGYMQSSTGVVTNDPNQTPNMAWQTAGDRNDLKNDSTRPGLVNGGPLQKFKIGVLLPTTGKNGELGNAMFKAAQMALFDIGATNIELDLKDTESTSTGAVNAAQQALSEGSQLLLGPIFADDVKAVKPIAGAAGVPMVAFTTDWTTAGNGTYVMGFLPFAQVSRVVQYAQAKGYNKFAFLAPQTEYCDVVLSTLQRTGATVTKVERYAPQTSDLTAEINAFAASSKTPDGPAFNALVLPLGGVGLHTLASTMAGAGISNANTRFLGTGLWDDPTISNDPAVYGGWFAAPDPRQRRDFEKRYQENYGSLPPRLSTLAYDATALAAVLARSGDEKPFTADHMTNQRGFAGIDGIFRFRGDGLSERGLAVMEIQAGRPQVIDPAPTAFGSGS